MKNQEKCIALFNKLMGLSVESANSVLRECDMSLEFIRKGPNTVPTDGELEHFADLMTEAIDCLNTRKE